MKHRLLLSATLFAVVASAPAADKEFRPLFNGRDLSGWNHTTPVRKNDSWEVVNGVLSNNLRPGRSGSDLATQGSFENFTLRLEFMVPEGSNSGVFLRGRYEIQLTGDYSDRKLGSAGNGAIFNQFAPAVYASKPSGDWQALEATLIGDKLTVLLNGKKIHDNVTLTGPTRNRPRGTGPGPIGLQGTLGSIKFRNIAICELPH